MNALTLMTAAMVQSIPAEYVIDCGTHRIPVTSLFQFTIETRDGTKYDVDGLEVSKDADPGVGVDLIMSVVKDNPDWLARQGQGNTVIVTGTKKSPIKSVSFISDGWKPVVRWQPLIQPKK